MKHIKIVTTALTLVITLFQTGCANKTEKNEKNSVQNYFLNSSDTLDKKNIENSNCENLSGNKTSLGNIWIKCNYSFTDKKSNAKLSIAKGDLPLSLQAYIDIKGDFGCIDENSKIKFVDSNSNETTFVCYNKERNCDTSQLLVFDIPVSNTSEKIIAYKIADASKIVIQKSPTNFIELQLSETDKKDLNKRINCIAESLK